MCPAMATELDLAAILCTLVLGGEPEVTHAYPVGYDVHRIRVDCETDTHVIEVGLDKRSSLDSVQQALFASSVTGKIPMVVMIDTDAREGPYELRVKTAAQMVGVERQTVDADWLIRWRMTSWLRQIRTPGSS